VVVAPQPVGESVKPVGHDVSQGVVGLDVAELLVRRPVGSLGPRRSSRRGLTGSALGTLAGRSGLLAQLPLEVGQPLLDVGAALGRRRCRVRRRRVAPALAGDRRVRVLDLLEPAGGFDRAVVVVGMVELDQAPVGRPELLVRYAG
jgi:hypothetical protein